MTLRQRLACSTAPIFLRLALAVVFLYSGVGKLNSMDYSPEQAARLANMGVARFAPPTAGNPQQPPANQPSEETPAETGQGGQSGQGGGVLPLVQLQSSEQPEEQEQEQPEQPAPEPSAEQPSPPPAQSLAGQPPAVEEAEEEQAPAGQQSAAAPVYSAADYAGPVPGRLLFSLALGVDSAAHPADGGRAIWPASLARGRQPVWIAWAVTLTEIAAGVLVLFGALSRLAGLALAGVMVGALWLTSIGPYLLGGKGGWAGFLPPMSDTAAWNTFLLQLTVFAAAMALLFAGAGALSVDRLVFGSPGGKAGDEDEDV